MNRSLARGGRLLRVSDRARPHQVVFGATGVIELPPAGECRRFDWVRRWIVIGEMNQRIGIVARRFEPPTVLNPRAARKPADCVTPNSSVALTAKAASPRQPVPSSRMRWESHYAGEPG